MNSSTDWWRPQKPQARKTTSVVPRLRGSALSYWALIGFTVILFLAPQQQFPVLAPLRIALLSVAVAVLACVYNRSTQRMPLIEMSPDVVLVLLLASWAVLGIPFSLWPGGSFNFLTGQYLKAIVFFLLLSHAVIDFRHLRGISWCLVLCTVPLTLVTLGNFVSGTYIEGAGNRVVGGSSGLTGNPNDMALTLNLILPLCIALFLGARSGAMKLVLAVISLLVVVAVIATFSRAGFLTLAFIGGCYAWLLRKRSERIWIPIILIAGVLALPLVPSEYFDRLDTIVNIEDDQTGSAQTRLADMKAAAGVAFANPLMGSGLGMSVLAMNDARGETWTEIHNVYLQLAADLGFPGLLLFLLLLAYCLRVTGDVAKRGSDDGASPQLVLLAEALRVSLLAFAVAAVFYPVAYNFYFYYFAGLAIAAARIARDEARVPQP